MPMYQGNYVAPVWINNMAPAIDETELLAMSGTIQASQMLTGSGPPTQYTSGVAGQRYADVSTTPPTIYRLVTAAEDANVWVPDAPRVGSIALSGTWTGAASPYSQTVTVTGTAVTASSKVDLQPTAAQIASLISDGVTGLVIENNAGTLTAYAVGAAPSAAMTVQCTVEETI